MLIGAALASGAAAESARDPAATPLLAMWEHAAGVSLEVAAPQLVIYQDGTVLARRDTERSGDGQFVTKQLPLADVNIWYDEIFAVARDEDLKGRYRLGGRSADRAATFYFQAGAHGLLVTVEGLAENSLSPFGTPLIAPAEEVPGRLLRVYQDARRLRSDSAAPWTPQSFEARLRPAPPGTVAARAWPLAWPKPEMTVDGRPAEGTFALRASDVIAARVLSWEQWQPVSVDDRVMHIALRPVLPGEQPWRRHIAADVDAARAAQTATSRTQLGHERDGMRTALQDRVGMPANPAGDIRPSLEVSVPPSPVLDRPTPSLSPIPRTPDPPTPKSKKTR